MCAADGVATAAGVLAAGDEDGVPDGVPDGVTNFTTCDELGDETGVEEAITLARMTVTVRVAVVTIVAVVVSVEVDSAATRGAATRARAAKAAPNFMSAAFRVDADATIYLQWVSNMFKCLPETMARSCADGLKQFTRRLGDTTQKREVKDRNGA